jgi:hypothetical protein
VRLGGLLSGGRLVVRARADSTGGQESLHDGPVTLGPRTGRASAAVGAAVGGYAFLDDLLLGPVLVAAAVWLPWYLVLGASAALFTFVNIACCNWVQRRWESWSGGRGGNLEERLERRRRSRLLRHPVRWMTRDSDVWVTIAAGLIGTVIVVGLVRLLGGGPVPARRVMFGSLAYSAGFAATYTGVGVGIDDLLRLL